MIFKVFNHFEASTRADPGSGLGEVMNGLHGVTQVAGAEAVSIAGFHFSSFASRSDYLTAKGRRLIL